MKDKIKSWIEELKKDKKKMILFGVGIVVCIAIIILLIVLLSGNGEEEKLKKYMKEMGTAFYEELYYEQIGKNDEERANFLKKYKDLGIKINLDGLSRYKTEENQEKIDSFKNSKTNEACNNKDSKVIVYPQEPYGKKDYRMEIVLECGFEEK
jgi:ABC-type lipoprotein release transport system permease subunit